MYEYQCSDCTYEFEVLQKASDKPIVKCEKCDGEKVVKVISPARFKLKGEGWYNKDSY